MKADSFASTFGPNYFTDAKSKSSNYRAPSYSSFPATKDFVHAVSVKHKRQNEGSISAPILKMHLDELREPYYTQFSWKSAVDMCVRVECACVCSGIAIVDHVGG